jgi:hypothetical protein
VRALGEDNEGRAGGLPKVGTDNSNLVQALGEREKELAAVKARLREQEGTRSLSGRELANRKAGLCSAQRKLEEWRAEEGLWGIGWRSWLKRGTWVGCRGLVRLSPWVERDGQ